MKNIVIIVREGTFTIWRSHNKNNLIDIHAFTKNPYCIILT